MKKILGYLLTGMVIIASALSVDAAIPQTINIQGVLKKDGVAAIGSYDMMFNISKDGGANSIWNESKTVVFIASQEGYFNVVLGETKPFASYNVDFTVPYWVKIHAKKSSAYAWDEIGTQPLLSVPYAFRAQYATTAEVANGLTPAAQSSLMAALSSTSYVKKSGDKITGLITIEVYAPYTRKLSVIDGSAYGGAIYGETKYTLGAVGVEGVGDTGVKGTALYYGGVFQGNSTGITATCTTAGSAVKADNTGSGKGILVTASTGDGINSTSSGGYGLYAKSINNYSIYAESTSLPAIKGKTTTGTGLFGEATDKGNGVKGSSNGIGVYGVTTGTYTTTTPSGVYGYSTGARSNGVYGETEGSWGDNAGVYGTSSTSNGIYGYSSKTTGGWGNGVYGYADSYIGVKGYSAGAAGSGIGVYGQTSGGIAVQGDSTSGYGGKFTSSSNAPIVTTGPKLQAIFGTNGTGVSIVADYPNIGLNASYLDSTGWRSIGTGFASIFGLDPSNGNTYLQCSSNKPSAGGTPFFENILTLRGSTGLSGLGDIKPGIVGRFRIKQDALNTDTPGFNLSGYYPSAVGGLSTSQDDRAFIGLAGADEVGFWGWKGAGWGLKMNVKDGSVIAPLFKGNTTFSNDVTVNGRVGVGASPYTNTRMRVYDTGNEHTLYVEGNSVDGTGKYTLWIENRNVNYNTNSYNHPGLGVDGYAWFAGKCYGPGFDYAEWSGVNENDIKAGDVVVIDPKDINKMKKSDKPYLTNVAGIISTDPGMVIGNDIKELKVRKKIADAEMEKLGYRMLALNGRVPCNVSAENGPIEPGDLLTTSSTPGYAMKVTDKAQAIGAVVGKALEPLKEGKGQIKVLVTLQ